MKNKKKHTKAQTISIVWAVVVVVNHGCRVVVVVVRHGCCCVFVVLTCVVVVGGKCTICYIT
jgi:hypothetical protein